MERIIDIPPYPPIPELKSSKGWKEVPIRECGESLVCLNDYSPRIIVYPQYSKIGIRSASPLQYARQTVAEKLVKASSYLPPKMGFIIWDSWRPLEVQQELFNNHLEKLKEKYSDLSLDRLTEIAQTYVSLPSSNPARPSPHYTGGAVDLSILGSDGDPLDMGTPFDHFGPEAATRYLEENQINTAARDNRRLLYYALTTVGFSVYDEEWWHTDFGNQFDAKRTGKEFAIYSVISLV